MALGDACSVVADIPTCRSRSVWYEDAIVKGKEAVERSLLVDQRMCKLFFYESVATTTTCSSPPESSDMFVFHLSSDLVLELLTIAGWKSGSSRPEADWDCAEQAASTNFVGQPFVFLPSTTTCHSHTDLVLIDHSSL